MDDALARRRRTEFQAASADAIREMLSGDPTLKTVSRMREPKETVAWEGAVTELVWPVRKHERTLFEAYEGETPMDMAKRLGHEEVCRITESV